MISATSTRTIQLTRIMRTSQSLVTTALFFSSLLVTVSLFAQQQLVDQDFRALVERPAYAADGPTIAIDEGHSNFHTAGGQYAPFAALLRNDGHRVVAATRAFDNGATLAGVGVLVIANARNLNALMAGDLSKPALTERECDVVRDWVASGGSLLLIADHAPYGQAVDNLAKRFGIDMGKGWAFERNENGGITTQLVFSRENGLLGVHPIISGRNETEQVRTVKSFTGQSLSIPSGAAVLMKLRPSTREAATPDDLDAEDEIVRKGDSIPSFGSRSKAVGDRAQGVAFSFRQGRVVVLGDAALLSAQILRFTEGNQQRDTKIGMNAPGNDNRQFALNILHWLSRLLN
jgi:hypothetical protein